MLPTIIRRAPKTNLTGFDIKAFVASSGTPGKHAPNDPWARTEAWRYEGQYTRFNRFKATFPGLGIATVAFAAYCGYEYMFLTEEHHGDGHGAEHH